MSRRKSKKSAAARGFPWWRWGITLVLLLLVVLPFALHRRPVLPPGTACRGATHLAAGTRLELLIDDTAFDPASGRRVIRQEIFDAALKMIQDADFCVDLDFFLWNSWQGELPESHRALAEELARALIRRRQEQPDLTALVLTDPINRLYARQAEPFYSELVAAGIPLVFTDLERLPDSNPLYSVPARLYGRLLARLPWVRNALDQPRFRNLFSAREPRLSARQMARLFHFKANHRKVLIAHLKDGAWRMLVTSFNPADGSAAHSNIGLLADGPVALEALAAELACVEWSAVHPGFIMENQPGACTQAVAALRARLPTPPPPVEPGPQEPYVQWLTEGAIRERVLGMLGTAGGGDRVSIGMFYLADRGVIRALEDAAAAGADIRLILDPNRDAFGRHKNGVPNRPVAAELVRRARREGWSLEVRWADTHGEQFHTKAISVSNRRMGKHELLCGSANWTRRNLQDFNLEAALFTAQRPDLNDRFDEYFNRAWSNSDGLSHTVPYESFAEKGARLFWKNLLYRFQEASGMSMF